jgi:hypothetical protein
MSMSVIVFECKKLGKHKLKTGSGVHDTARDITEILRTEIWIEDCKGPGSIWTEAWSFTKGKYVLVTSNYLDDGKWFVRVPSNLKSIFAFFIFFQTGPV